MSEKVIVEISKSDRKGKKYQADINGKRTIHFGAAGYEDYTIHKNPQRKERYIQRHKGKEDWTKEGIATPSYLSRFVLWNKPTIQASLNDLNSKYKDIKFKLK